MQQDGTYLQSQALNLRLRQWRRRQRQRRRHLLPSLPPSLGGRLRRRAASSSSSFSQLLARSASRLSSPLAIIPPLPSARPSLAPPHLLAPPPPLTPPFSRPYLLFFPPQLLKLRVAAVAAVLLVSPASLESKRQSEGNQLKEIAPFNAMGEQTVETWLFYHSIK